MFKKINKRIHKHKAKAFKKVIKLIKSISLIKLKQKITQLKKEINLLEQCMITLTNKELIKVL